MIDKILFVCSSVKKERRALTEIEIKRIIEFKHRCQLPAMIMLFSGLRRGELIALQWLDIDLVNKTITVNKSVDVQSNTAINKKAVNQRVRFV